MEEKVIKLKITDNSIEVVGHVEKIKQSFDDVDKSVNKVNGDLDKFESNAKQVSTGLQKIGQSLGSISSNVKGIGLGLLVTQFDDFKQALAGSGVASDFLNTSLNVTKKGAKDLIDVISKGELLQTLQGGVKSIFDGTAVEKIKNYGKESISAAKNATDLVNKANVAAVRQQGILETYDRQAEQQRLIRDNVLLDLNTRRKASVELNMILEKQTSEMLAQANIQKEAAKAIYGISGSREDYLKTLESENNILSVKAQIQGLLTEQTMADNSLILEGNQNEQQSEKLLLDLKYQRKEVENSIYQVTKEGKKENGELEEQIIERFTTEKRRLQEFGKDLVSRYKDTEQYYDKVIAKTQEGSTARIEIENQRLQELESINNQILQNDYNAYLEDVRIDELRLQNKLAYIAAIGSAVGQLSGLFEQGTAAAKTAALAEIAINTGVGFMQGLDIAQKSAKAAGPGAAFAFPIFYATQVAAVLGAASRAKSILQSGNTSGGASGVSASSPASMAPRFNVVGVNPVNQIAQAVGNQGPIEAYVVASKVTTAQSLDRNKITSATLG
jgi:hypothetical protein